MYKIQLEITINKEVIEPRYNFKIILHNAQGLQDPIKLEYLVNWMIDNNIDTFLVQKN